MSQIENNKLIAEFMGLEIVNADIILYELNGIAYPINKLQYHTSWDWLMPVLKKINLEIHPDSYGAWRMITHCVEYRIEDVHSQVVEFIKQHNK